MAAVTNPLLEGAVTKTELGQPIFADADDAVEAIRVALTASYAHPLAELHLGIVPQQDGRVLIQGLLIHRREEPPAARLVHHSKDEGE